MVLFRELDIECNDNLCLIIPRIHKIGRNYTFQPMQMFSHKIDKNSLHIWPRGNFMLMALANLDGTLHVLYSCHFKGENSFESLNDETSLVDFFCKNIFQIPKEVNSRFSA